MSSPNRQYWRPNLQGKIAPEADFAIRNLYDGVADHDNAINSLSAKVSALQSSSTTSSTTSSSTSSSASTTTTTAASAPAAAVQTIGRTGVSPTGQIAQSANSTAATNTSYAQNAYISGVNLQSGTTYTVQTGDYASLIVFNTNSAVTVTLNNAVMTNFTCQIVNLGTAEITIVAPSGSSVNGASDVVLAVGGTTGVFFTGSIWYALTNPDVITPMNTVEVAHEFLTSYNAANGVFGQARPAYSDISGTPQLPLNEPGVAHEWINAYNSTTGAFTQSQPAYSDLTGTPQLPLTEALVASQFLTSYTASTGAFTQAQPAITDVSGLSAALALLAPIASPTFTGTVTQPTPSVITAAITATSATAGTATALPSLPVGYLEISINSVTYKIPYFAV